jgi:hypothetical protein
MPPWEGVHCGVAADVVACVLGVAGELGETGVLDVGVGVLESWNGGDEGVLDDAVPMPVSSSNVPSWSVYVTVNDGCLLTAVLFSSHAHVLLSSNTMSRDT